MEWFTNLESTLQVALVSGIATVLAAIISGIFAILSNKKKDGTVKKSSDSTTFTQKINGNHNTVIGIQNNVGGKNNE